MRSVRARELEVLGIKEKIVNYTPAHPIIGLSGERGGTASCMSALNNNISTASSSHSDSESGDSIRNSGTMELDDISSS